MQTRYQNLLDELHTNKRELTNYRQKFVTLQSELLAKQQQARNFKKTIASQKQTIQKLTQQNKKLMAQKDSILTEYSTSVESIKDQISKKQQEIYILKLENSFTPMNNQRLYEKQLRCEIESEFEAQLEAKEKRIKELSDQISKLSFDKVVEKQKYQIKLESMEKELKEMQNAQMIELQNYANRTYQNSQFTKTSEEQTLIKKLRRQIDELRISLDSAKQELHDSISEKTKIQKQHSAFVNKHNKEIQQFAQEIRVLQFDNQRFQSAVSRAKPQKDQYLIKEKQKQIKSLKDQIEELHQKINKLHSKHSELQVELVNKDNEVKKHKEFNQKHENDKISELKMQSQSYKKELSELKQVNESIRKQNIELINSLSDINIKSVHNIQQQNTNNQRHNHTHNMSAFSQESRDNRESNNNNQRVSISEHQNSTTVITAHKNTKNKNKHTTINEYEENQEIENSFNTLQRAKSSNNLKVENVTKLELYKKHYEDECHKNKELAHKYVELKKRYVQLEQKLNQANNKLMELLRDKIQLNSPTAASQKSFHFPTSPNPKYFMSPEQGNAQNFHQNVHLSRTHQVNVNSLRDLHFSPQYTLTRGRKEERSESQTKGDQSFYQKSLKVKNSHKFREIKCLNHDDPQQDHAQCSHNFVE